MKKVITINTALISFSLSISLTTAQIQFEQGSATSSHAENVLMTERPGQGKIVSEIINENFGYTELMLGNGVRVVLKSTDLKNDEILMEARRFGGSSTFTAKDKVHTELASEIVSAMGVADYSPSDLDKLLAGRHVWVTSGIYDYHESIGGSCSKSDVEAMLQLLYLRCTEPRMDKELFDSFMQKQRAYFQNWGQSPEIVYNDSLIGIIFQNHPWAFKMPSTEKYRDIDVNRAFAIYQNRFSSMNGFTFVFAGNLPPDIKELVVAYLGSIPRGKALSKYIDVGLRPTRSAIKKELKIGTDDKSKIAMRWYGESPFHQKESLCGSLALEILEHRLTNVLREDLGFVYSPHLYSKFNKHPYNHYEFGINITCAPKNVQKVIEVIKTEIKYLSDNQPTEEEMSKVKEPRKVNAREFQLENSFWTFALIDAFVTQERSLAEHLNFEDAIDQITPAEITSIFVKYFGKRSP